MGEGAPLLQREVNGPLLVNNGHVELIEDRVCKHDTPSESDPGDGIKTALIRVGSKLCRRVFVSKCQEAGEHLAYLTRTNILFGSLDMTIK